jgi:hypothetical protein
MDNHKLVVIPIDHLFFVFLKYDENVIFVFLYEICKEILEFDRMHIK